MGSGFTTSHFSYFRFIICEKEQGIGFLYLFTPILIKDNFKSFFNYVKPDWQWVRERIKKYEE